MKLAQFNYHYRIRDKEAKLLSITATFAPFSSKDELADPAQARTLFKKGFDKLTQFLDEQLLQHQDAVFKSKPFLDDSARMLTVGERYKGRMRFSRHPYLILYSLPFANFFSKVSFSDFLFLEADVTAEFYKKSVEYSTLSLHFALTEKLNIPLLNELLAMPDIEITEQAAKEIANLRQILDAAGKFKMMDLLTNFNNVN